MEYFINLCKYYVKEYYNNKHLSFRPTILEDITIVWCCKTIQNKKCILINNQISDRLFFECTENGDRGEIYMDVYNKVDKETHELQRINIELE